MELTQRTKVGFIYTVEHTRGSECLSRETIKNIIPTEGLDYLLSASLVGGVPYSAWFLGLYEGDLTPTLNSLMATFPATAVETTAYTSATRPVWVPDPVSDGAILNTLATADFVMDHAVGLTKLVFGGFMATSPTKAGTTGPLLSAVRFDSPKPLLNGDTLHITAGISLLAA